MENETYETAGELGTSPAPDGQNGAASGSDPRRLSRTERRSRSVADALRTLVRDLFADQYGARAPEGDLSLVLRVRLRPAEKWALSFEPPLPEQLAEQLADAQAARLGFVRGSVYCYRCERTDCEHARPPTPRSVFAGYDAAGRPTWEELPQALLRVRHPRVDELFGRPPAVLAGMQYGREVRGEQLTAFGRASKTYAVLGQVVAGYFEAPRAAGAAQEAPERLAVTFQVVESRGAKGEFRLQLNTLAAMPDGVGFDAWIGGSAPMALFRAQMRARREVAALEAGARAARERGDMDAARKILQRVPGVLHRLADALERGARQAQRRTRHAEIRRAEQRPVPKAIEDALASKDEAIFYDLKAQTFVVAGPKGRTHAFTDEGRHVTSFFMRPGAAEFRVRTGRWRAAEPAEVQALRDRWATGPS
ncbi:MAG: hypothetical protein NZ740_00550 [Kiritimatiellae bacterium]|nr:hypothetical protein [Kiritimatiellia bacterium]MDW8457579.1 hypothetical protein [Verrucomicrobiota bacterium]